jgi:hypothetical protein
MALRDTQVSVETLETEPNPNTRVTQVAVEILEETNLMQVAQQFVNVISYNDPVNTFQVAQQFVNIISKNPIQTVSFVGDDGDPPDPSIWLVESGTPVIDTNQLEFLVNSGTTKEKVKNKKLLAGDFEVYIDIDVSEEPTQDNWMFGLGVKISNDEYFQISREYDSVNDQDVVVRTSNDGPETVYRVSANPSSTVLKIKKTGNVFRGWYWDGLAFVQVGDASNVALSPDEFWVYMVAETKNNEAQLRVLVSKFVVLAGYLTDPLLQNVFLTIIEG